jgi:hypothetical protein
MRIIVFTLTALIHLAAAAVGFLILLLAMNGYSGSQAEPGLILYIALGLSSALVLGLASSFVVKRLVERRSWGSLAAAAISIFGFSIIGGVVLVVSFFAAIMLAELMR